MITGYVIRKNEYHDSVFLMRVAKRISEQKGILQAVLFMGTEKNKGVLAEIGFAGAEIAAATPSDLILAVKADSQQNLTAVLENINQWLQAESGGGTASAIRNLDEALARQPLSNLAVISVPGAYAAREAEKALERGLNVFLFSDNVPVESERSLKEYARERGLIVMGPDCGTAIIGGVGVGFANVVRRGPIGVIGASGTGIQEFTTLVHRAGSGISHAIGTGSRDLSDALGGISMLSVLDALDADLPTKAIAIISKPPGPMALANIVPRILQCQKPVVVCFLGLKKELAHANIRYQIARTLDEAAALAVQTVTGNLKSSFSANSSRLQALILKERTALNSDQQYIRGIFAGGTFCYQAQQVLKEAGLAAYSNAPIEGNSKLPDPLRSKEHTLVDMGADEFTAGRPHPMIDSRLRRERLIAEAKDPQVAIILLDFILGFNSSPDPAGELAPAIAQAKREAKKRGGFLSVVASVCGTDEDPQGLRQQVTRLEDEGVAVFPSSSQAAQFCALMVARLQERSDVQ
ncbi:MAG: acyl-CoA synthetase FdrA [Thermodesulfobacteriota bacterium]|nr:acyl-CoA synthetase FdrA [Thermodesulfobacteriota bacterium]